MSATKYVHLNPVHITFKVYLTFSMCPATKGQDPGPPPSSASTAPTVVTADDEDEPQWLATPDGVVPLVDAVGASASTTPQDTYVDNTNNISGDAPHPDADDHDVHDVHDGDATHAEQPTELITVDTTGGVASDDAGGDDAEKAVQIDQDINRNAGAMGSSENVNVNDDAPQADQNADGSEDIVEVSQDDVPEDHNGGVPAANDDTAASAAVAVAAQDAFLAEVAEEARIAKENLAAEQLKLEES